MQKSWPCTSQLRHQPWAQALLAQAAAPALRSLCSGAAYGLSSRGATSTGKELSQGVWEPLTGLSARHMSSEPSCVLPNPALARRLWLPSERSSSPALLSCPSRPLQSLWPGQCSARGRHHPAGLSPALGRSPLCRPGDTAQKGRAWPCFSLVPGSPRAGDTGPASGSVCSTRGSQEGGGALGKPGALLGTCKPRPSTARRPRLTSASCRRFDREATRSAKAGTAAGTDAAALPPSSRTGGRDQQPPQVKRPARRDPEDYHQLCWPQLPALFRGKRLLGLQRNPFPQH